MIPKVPAQRIWGGSNLLPAGWTGRISPQLQMRHLYTCKPEVLRKKELLEISDNPLQKGILKVSLVTQLWQRNWICRSCRAPRVPPVPAQHPRKSTQSSALLIQALAASQGLFPCLQNTLVPQGWLQDPQIPPRWQLAPSLLQHTLMPLSHGMAETFPTLPAGSLAPSMGQPLGTCHLVHAPG